MVCFKASEVLDYPQPSMKKKGYASPEYFLEQVLYPEIDSKTLQIIPCNSAFIEIGATNLQTVSLVDPIEDAKREVTNLSIDGVVPFLQVIGRYIRNIRLNTISLLKLCLVVCMRPDGIPM